MLYFSTRNSKEKVTASQAISRGLAPDGGLYVPESLPQLTLNDIKALGREDYRGRALGIMKPFLDEFSETELKAMVSRAYGDNLTAKALLRCIFLTIIPLCLSFGTDRPARLRTWLFKCFLIF